MMGDDGPNGTKTNSLMASLMGSSDDGGGDQDLFGDVPIVDDEPPPLAVSTPPPPPTMPAPAAAAPMGASLPPAPSMTASAPPLVPTPVPAPAPSNTTSLLAQSGLLMGDGPSGGGAFAMGGNDGGGGGLFDEVDQEEEEKQRQEAEKRRQEEAVAAARQAEAEAQQRRVKEAADEAERQRQMQLLQQQQQQQFHNPNGSYPQQQSAMMQSAVMPATNHFQQPQQQQPNMMTQSMQNMTLNDGFYRQHPSPSPNASVMNNNGYNPSTPQQQAQQQSSNAYRGGAGAPNNYYYGTQQQQQQQQQTPPSYYQQQPQIGGPIANGTPNQKVPGLGSITAGMHNPHTPSTPNHPNHHMPGSMMGRGTPHQGQLTQVRKIVLQKPPDVPPLYTHIQVSEPMLIQNPSFLISSPPYWSYQIRSTLNTGPQNPNNNGQPQPPQQIWLVRRRFRHVVALEDRLRQVCPGSILPPRPEKHATRALEEASAQQSAEFAMHRAKELEIYLSSLAQHPVAGHSQVLRLFLGLQDDIGTAWPEVSNNAFTKLGAVAQGVTSKVAEYATTGSELTSGNAPAQEWEDNAELLTLCSSEHLRMGAVSQAVPKLEGTVTLYRELGDAAGALGMEMSKLGKDANDPTNEEFKGCDVLANGLLRHGRRTKRLALELSASLEPFLQQYKMVRYEKMAMQDRRHAIQKQHKERGRADARAMILAQQQQQQMYGGGGNPGYDVNRLQMNAVHSDEVALDVVQQANQVASRLESEIHRVAIQRRKEWNVHVKQIAKSCHEASIERLALWQSTLDTLEQAFGTKTNSNNSAPVSEVSVVGDINSHHNP